MTYYALQSNKTSLFIQTEKPVHYTSSLDKALLFKEDVIKAKLKTYLDHKAVKYYSLGNIVNKY